jgi:hypothetical protein
MSENESTGQGAAPESTPESTSGAPKKDVAAEIKKMPAAEKLLGLAAVVVLLSFIIDGPWNALFKYRWFPTCSFLGSVGVIALISVELFGVKLMDAKMRIYLLIVLAMLPAVGFVVDMLKNNFWQAVMLAGGIAMGVAGARITTREKILR